jgi:hypothetical protein
MMPGSEIIASGAFIEIFKWVWQNLGKDITESSAKGLTKAWEEFKHHRAAQRYAEQMKKQHDIVHIWRMSSPISLEEIFTDVNVLSKPSAFRNTPKEQLEKIYLGKTTFGEVIEKGKNGLAAVRENKKLFILGKPGAGKTTFLKHITLRAINGDLDLIPIFIPLKLFSEKVMCLRLELDQSPLLNFITSQFKICDFPDAQPFIKTMLKKGKAIVLCDGLDEVNTEEGLRDRVIRKIIDFSNEYNESQYIITCRVAATEYCFEGFTYVEMADFNDDQIKNFVYKWFADKQQVAESFFKEFNGSANVRLHDLANNPLLLTLLCLAFEETLQFPVRRSEIYQEALDALLKKWDTTRLIKRDEIYRKLFLGRKSQMFARIAAETFEKKEYLIELKRLERKVEEYLQHLPPADASEDIDGAAVVKAIESQHGIFVERAKGIYSFSHLTFQEYYTARYIVDNMQKGTLGGLICNHLTDSSWREVFLLTAEMMDEANEFFELFLSALDNFADQNERLAQLLVKAGKEAKEMYIRVTDIRIKPYILRNRIIILILDTAFGITCAIGIGLAHTIGINLNSANVSDIDSLIASTIDIDSDIDSDIARARGSTFTRAKAIAIAKDVARASTSAIDSAIDSAIASASASPKHYNSLMHYYNNALRLIEQKGLADLNQVLTHVSVPSQEDSPAKWEEFSDALLDIMRAHRPIKDYEFTKEQAENISQYLKATKLLQDCLAVAYVSDRKAIEDRLLLPPKAAQRTVDNAKAPV